MNKNIYILYPYIMDTPSSYIEENNTAPQSKPSEFADIVLWKMTNTLFEDRIFDTPNYRPISVRGVILDQEKNVAIIYSPKEHYYKLPGGWVEPGESNEIAIWRESKEEAWVVIAIQKYIWTIIEQSKSEKIIQKNRCFIVKVVREKGTPELTEEEIERKFELHRLDIDEAIDRMTKQAPSTYRWTFMQERDLQFLQEARKYM